ncbi:MAG: hypothetical protein MZW92_23630 [Comamonadaceae bacterium]|nr:hypothetical protein [Comamonadaceae bacterium]
MRGQEAHQRARPLGEDEAEQALVVRQLAAPAHHVAHVLLGQFVVGQVDGGEAVAHEVALDAARPRRGCAIAMPTKTCAPVGVGDAVVELGHARAGRSARRSA